MTSSLDISEQDLVICSLWWGLVTLDLDVVQYFIFDNEDIWARVS